MKRIIIFFSVFLMHFVSLSAQEYKYEAKLGWFPADVLNLVYLMGEDPSGIMFPFVWTGVKSS